MTRTFGPRRRTAAEFYWRDRVQNRDSLVGGGALVALVLVALGLI